VTHLDAGTRRLIKRGRWLHGLMVGQSRPQRREDLLQLRESYALQWEDYSRPASGAYGGFRHLVVEVEGEASTPVPDPSVVGTHWYALMNKFSG
jgi:hypothetical protein